MARRQPSRRHRSSTRLARGRATDARSIGWRSVLLGAPLCYGVGVLAGDALTVSLLGTPPTVLLSGIVVLLACGLASVGLDGLIERLKRPEPRSIGSIGSPRTTIGVGAAVLLPAFLLGIGLATLT